MLNQDQSGVTLALNSGALATGSTLSQIAIATAVNYLFKGVFFQRATSASIAFPIVAGTGAPATPNAYTNLPTGFTCAYLIVVDPLNASAVAGVQGAIVPNGDGAPVPPVPNNKVAIGVMKIVNTSVGDFIAGTTLSDVAGITDTYINLGAHPGASV